MFKLKSKFLPKGDQVEAIEKLVKGCQEGRQAQVLLGVTGSGKTFTMANTVARVQKPSLVIAHNKTLAAQLYQEFKELFPENAVEYFVSYYDYYQPEAYIPRSDSYIEKDMAINDRIDKMRLSATRSLLERDDVLIVASVSCIYGLGMPEFYREMNLYLECGKEYRHDEILLHLIEMAYKRNDYDFQRGNFRVRGDILEIFPAYEENLAYRIEFYDMEVERISLIDPLTAKVLERPKSMTLYPGSHHVTPESVRLSALESIQKELKERASQFKEQEKFLEHQRILERTRHDLEMIREIGSCKGIENYSRHFSQRAAGEPPPCLLDYFPKDFLLIIDESHQTIPQMKAMYHGDYSRKRSLVDYGFRLPSAYDNRPLRFEESSAFFQNVIFVSATPAAYEIERAEDRVIEQIIRPTGLLDPIIDLRPAKGQVDDCIDEIHRESKKGNKILVTTLTKRLAEDLSKYLNEIGVKARYLHSDIDTIERIAIIEALRKGEFDALIGINLLREGLDIPEVSLVAILDADKEGFLRSETSLIQTCGRAARNVNGRVIMYADKETDSIKKTIEISKARREKQKAYNLKHAITPQTVQKGISCIFEEFKKDPSENKKAAKKTVQKQEHLSAKDVEKRIKEYEKAMKKAAKEYRFEEAARYRDLMRHYQEMEMDLA